MGFVPIQGERRNMNCPKCDTKMIEERNYIVSDWKITSVFSFLLGEKPEWTAQINCYAYLFEQYRFPVKKAFIHAILRDWMVSKSLQDEDYPKCPFITSEIEVWDKEKQFTYIDGRVYIHELAQIIADDHLLNCTPQEKWSKPTTWAVKKVKAKRALRVFHSLEEADNMIQCSEDGLTIEERPGEDVRCERFCYAKNFCCQYRREHPK